VAGADHLLAEHQRGERPGALHDAVDMWREILHRGRSARQLVERLRQVGGDARQVEIEAAHDALPVRILMLQQLVRPVRELDVGVATHLAEHRRALDGLVGDRIQLAEQRFSSNL
jgi:hypothetical protein